MLPYGLLPLLQIVHSTSLCLACKNTCMSHHSSSSHLCPEVLHVLSCLAIYPSALFQTIQKVPWQICIFLIYKKIITQQRVLHLDLPTARSELRHIFSNNDIAISTRPCLLICYFLVYWGHFYSKHKNVLKDCKPSL